MSERTSNARGGEFATARRPRAADHVDFILAKHAAGVPVSAIARMIGCNVTEVSRLTRLGQPDEEECVPVEGQVAADPEPHALPKIRIKRGKPQTVRREDEWAEARKAKQREMPKRARLIVEEIARLHGVRLEDLIGYRLLKGLNRARNHAIYKLYATGNYSTPLLGAYFGGRDHTSILNAIRNHGIAMAEALSSDEDRREAA